MPSATRRNVRLRLLRLAGRALASAPGGRASQAAHAGGGPARVLLLRPDHVGDVLLTAPALALLRAELPRAHLTYVVGPWSREVADHGPPVDELRTLPYPGFLRAANANLLWPYALLAREAARLRRERYDLAIVFRADHWWAALLAAFAGIPVRVGAETPETSPLLTHARPPRVGEHAAEQALGLAALGVSCVQGDAAAGRTEDLGGSPAAPASHAARGGVAGSTGATRFTRLPEIEGARREGKATAAAGATTAAATAASPPIGAEASWDEGARATADAGPAANRATAAATGRAGAEPGADATATADPVLFRVSDAARQRAADLWRIFGLDGRQVVALQPSAGAPLKRWPIDRWAALGDRLAGAGTAVVLTGAPSDAALLSAIAERMATPPRAVLCGQSLDISAACYERAALVIGLDGGGAHLAAAVGTPTVRLYGPAPVDAFGPWPRERADQHVLVAETLACVPCGHLEAPPCGARTLPACLLAIGVDEVLEVASRQLHRR